MHLFGIDLGGTKIEGAVVDSDHPDQPLCRLRLPTESARGYDHILAQVAQVVVDLERAAGLRRPARIGIGTPGTTDPATGEMKNANTTCLNGRTLRADLSRILGVEAVLANDANCFALAEAHFGAGRGRAVVLGLILGTGVGGGLVVHGQVLEGCHGIAGEWGHNPICGETTRCYCGRQGCVETVLAGPALERFYEGRTGTPLRLREIVAEAQTGAPAAVATLDRLVAKFGEAIAAVINVVDPDAIVIGGGVGHIDLLYTDATRAAIQRHLFNPTLRTELLRPTLGDSAGVFGAALLTS